MIACISVITKYWICVLMRHLPEKNVVYLYQVQADKYTAFETAMIEGFNADFTVVIEAQMMLYAGPL